MPNVPSSQHNIVPTTYEDWARSDRYHNSFLLPAADPVLDAVLKKNRDDGLPDIAVSAAQGRFLNLLARSVGARRILEVGTLGGYSTIWLARALPESGSLLTLEISEKHAKTARENITNAGLAHKVEVVVGPAVQSLSAIPSPPSAPAFELAFIDADKPSNLAYFTEAKRLVRRGGVIIVDNVVRAARVSDPALSDANIEGVRRLLQGIKGDEEVEAVTVATVGEKGHDGFLYAIRK